MLIGAVFAYIFFFVQIWLHLHMRRAVYRRLAEADGGSPLGQCCGDCETTIVFHMCNMFAACYWDQWET